MGVNCAILRPFVIQNGVIHQLSRFEAAFGCSEWKRRLSESDVNIASIYGKLYILVLKYGNGEQSVESLNMYLLIADAAVPPKLAHSLKLNLIGQVGVHVIDNVIVVHHKISTRSYLYDIALGEPTVEVRPMLESTITIGSELKSAYNTENEVSLYSPSWVVFSPNFIVDARFGIFTRLQLDTAEAHKHIEDPLKLLSFLANRTSKGDNVYLETLRDLLRRRAISIAHAATIFNSIVDMPRTAHITTRDSSSKFRLVAVPWRPLRVGYNEIAQLVLHPLIEQPVGVDMKFLAAVALEFLLVIRRNNVRLEHHFFAELLMRALVEAGDFAKLKQLLQYRVLDDSKFLAFALITLGQQRPEFNQLAVDMLRRRLRYEQIVEHRLSHGRVIEALSCLNAGGTIDRALCLRILEVAWASDNRQTKYIVYTTLRDVRKLPFFDVDDEQLAAYTHDFKSLFNDAELEAAERRFRLAEISDTSFANLGGGSAEHDTSTQPTIASSRADSLNGSLDTTSVHSEDLDLNATAPGAGVRSTD